MTVHGRELAAAPRRSIAAPTAPPATMGAPPPAAPLLHTALTKTPATTGAPAGQWSLSVPT
jgi:hypothetical protein